MLIVIVGVDSWQMEKSAQEIHRENPYFDFYIWPEISQIGKRATSKSQADQYRWGYYEATKDADKRNIVVVTHSDHIFTGIRVAIKQNWIPHDQVEIRFYRPAQEMMTIRPDRDGRLPTWPAGLFDQLEIGMAALIRRN